MDSQNTSGHRKCLFMEFWNSSTFKSKVSFRLKENSYYSELNFVECTVLVGNGTIISRTKIMANTSTSAYIKRLFYKVRLKLVKKLHAKILKEYEKQTTIKVDLDIDCLELYIISKNVTTTRIKFNQWSGSFNIRCLDVDYNPKFRTLSNLEKLIAHLLQ